MRSNPASTLLEQLLWESQSLTAVERFARTEAVPAKGEARFYRQWLPGSPPGPGQQYAFEVDLDRCSGCKACVTACHALNGLEEQEAWREVGLLTGPEAGPIHVSTACHHCIDPGCLNGCPVLAYEKDSVTGIVRHLDDQCIGCQYCLMMCPYEVPRYSHRLGIVRKCDMCHQRLADGEPPACAQACPNQAIRIALVDQASCVQQHRAAVDCAEPTASFLPDAPNPSISIPTTTFRSRYLPQADLQAADRDAPRLADPHWPLVLLLVLSQWSVGVTGAAWVDAMRVNGPPSKLLLGVGLGALVTALITGFFHLGKPARAWKAFLGWRTSWFSREIILFGAYANLLGATWLTSELGTVLIPIGWLLPLTFVTGLLAVFCSVMIYVKTQRPFWALGRTAWRFGGTTLLGGAVGWFTLSGLHGTAQGNALILLVGAIGIKLAFELAQLRSHENEPHRSLARSAQLLSGPLRARSGLRVCLGLLGGMILPVVLGGVGLFMGTGGLIRLSTVLVLLLAGEVIERLLFFRAVAPDRMPGAVTT